MSPGPRKSRTLGAWLSLLALYVQVLLPMLIAVELRLADASGPASAAFAMCGGGHGSTGTHDGGGAGASGTGDNHSRHCCPLCTAIGASYIAAAEIFLAVPASWTSIVLRASGVTAVPHPRLATYDARAPPPILLKPFGRSPDRPNGAYLFNAKFIPVHARKSCLLLPIDAA